MPDSGLEILPRYGRYTPDVRADGGQDVRISHAWLAGTAEGSRGSAACATIDRWAWRGGPADAPPRRQWVDARTAAAILCALEGNGWRLCDVYESGDVM